MPRFETLFCDSSQIGLSISYAARPRPEGPAQAFVIGKEFIGGQKSRLVRGADLFPGYSLPEILQRAVQFANGGVVFG